MSTSLALWTIPLLAALFSRQMAPAHFWRNTGIAFGLVVAPASFGLYGLYFIGPLAALLGMIGLVVGMLHGTPGYNIAVAVGLIPSGEVITGVAGLPVDILNAVIWGVSYGTVGWFIDRWRRCRRLL